MLKIITFFFSSLSFNNVSLSTNLTTVGSPKEAKTGGWVSNAWIVKAKCIYFMITIFFLQAEYKHNWVTIQKWLRNQVLYKKTAIFIFIFYTYISIYSSTIYIHTSEIWFAIALQSLSLLDYSRLVLTGCFPTSFESNKIRKTATYKVARHIIGYLHDLQIEHQVQEGCHLEEHHSTAALQLLQSMKSTFSELRFGESILLSCYKVT